MQEKYNQKKLAEELGISRQSVGKWLEEAIEEVKNPKVVESTPDVKEPDPYQQILEKYNSRTKLEQERKKYKKSVDMGISYYDYDMHFENIKAKEERSIEYLQEEQRKRIDRLERLKTKIWRIENTNEE